MEYQEEKNLGSIPNYRSGEARARLSVADRLQQFGQYGLERYQDSMVARAQEEAGQVEPGTEAPQQKSSTTVVGQVYNKTVIAGHVAAIRNDYTRHLMELEGQHQTNPQAFVESAKAYRASMLNKAAPEIRSQIATDFERAMIAPTQRIKDKAMEVNLIESGNEILQAGAGIREDMLRAYRKGNLENGMYYQGQLETMAGELEAAGFQKEANDLIKSLEDDIDKQIVLSQFDTAREAGQGREFIRDFMENPPEDLSTDQWDKYVADMEVMQNRYERLNAEQKVQLTMDQEKQVSDLKIGARTGMMDADYIVDTADQMFANKWITADERASVITSAIKNDQAKLEKANAAMAEMDERALMDSQIELNMAGEGAFFIPDKEQDRYYQEKIMPLLAQDPQSAMGETVEFIKTHHRVPKPLKGQLEAMMMSQNPEFVSQAAVFIDQIDEIPGIVGSTFSKEQEAYISTVLPLMQNLEPKEAIRLARESSIDQRPEMLTAKEDSIKEGKWRDNYMDDVEDEFGSLDEGNKYTLAKEYQDLFESYYKAGMSEDAAREKTAKILKRNWSEWNGRMMKYSPDKFYSVGGETEYVMGQLVADVNQNYWNEEPLTADDLILLSNERTAKTASRGRPEYRVAIIKDGTMEVLANTWIPDVESEIARRQEQNRKMLEKGIDKEMQTLGEKLESLPEGAM